MPAGRPPKDPSQKVTRHAMKYPWTESGTQGWRWEKPKPPTGLSKEARDAWDAWFTAWWAVHYELEDVPALRNLIRLFDQVSRRPDDRGLQSELHRQMNTWGLTTKGRTDNRWLAPKVEEEPKSEQSGGRRRLRVVDAS